MYHKILDKLLGKKIAILGFGMEGKSTYTFLRKHSDMPLTIIDKKNVLESHPELKEDTHITCIFGEDYLEKLDGFDWIIKSPGVITKDIPTDHLPFTSQLELLLEVARQKVIGITATKGKSTTSTLVFEALKRNGLKTYLLGNIGKPIFDEIENFEEDTWLVIEMSALQLEFVHHSPHIAAILNLYQDHLDHSGTVEHYHQNKLNIFKYQEKTDFKLYFTDIEPLNSYIDDRYQATSYALTLQDDQSLNTTSLVDGKVLLNGKELYDSHTKTALLGEHNLRNIMVVLTISEILGLDIEKTKSAIMDFQPLEHRMEKVGKYHDIIFYNDTISTIPIATIYALKTLENVDTLIFGGMDRGIDYQELTDYLNQGVVRNLICMPTTGHTIGKKINHPSVHCYFVETLKEAVDKAKEVTRPNSICLLSPAASSYEYFKNFEEKGRAYKNLVKESESIYKKE